MKLEVLNASPPYTTQELAVKTRQDCPPPAELLNLKHPPDELYKVLKVKCKLFC